MKNRTTSRACLALLLLAAMGCSDQFIDLVPPTQISTASYYKTKADMDGAVIATYASLQGTYNDLFIFTEISTDNTYTPPEAIGTGWGDYDVLPVSPTQAALNGLWGNLYATVARSNIALTRIDAVPMDATLKARYVGELKALRALAYFNLVRFFGDVPLVTSEVTSVDDLYAFSRETTAKVYEQITKDLGDAEKVLPATYPRADLGRVTAGAAKALLGKVYLTQKKWPEAAAKLKEVIDAGTYTLLPNYADLFRADNGNNAEVVLAVQYTKGNLGEGSPFTNRFATHNSLSGTSIVAVGEAQGHSQVTPDLAAAFDAADLRRTTSVGVVRDRFFYTRKYIDVPTGPFDADNDWLVIRYADVLLMYAEALNEGGQTAPALTVLNQVRKRAGLPDRTGLSQAEFRLAVETERRLELSMEGHRWFDLVRTGRLQPVMDAYYAKNDVNRNTQNTKVPTFATLFPIPFLEVQKNPTNLKQNPGY